MSGVLEILSREIELRPNEYLWNYEGIWQSAPEDVLEKACTATDVVSMLDALAINGINPQMLSDLKSKVSSNPKIIAWLKRGFDELKEWWIKKNSDPSFDPYDEEEETE